MTAWPLTHNLPWLREHAGFPLTPTTTPSTRCARIPHAYLQFQQAEGIQTSSVTDCGAAAALSTNVETGPPNNLSPTAATAAAAAVALRNVLLVTPRDKTLSLMGFTSSLCRFGNLSPVHELYHFLGLALYG
jgi:hypothetical protein